MTTTTKDAVIVSVLMIGGIAVMVTDAYKIPIRWLWDLTQTFWFTYIAF